MNETNHPELNVGERDEDHLGEGPDVTDAEPCPCCGTPIDADCMVDHLVAEVRDTRKHALKAVKALREAQNDRADAIRERDELRHLVSDTCDSL